MPSWEPSGVIGKLTVGGDELLLELDCNTRSGLDWFGLGRLEKSKSC